MFYSHCFLSRKGPLGAIWVAAYCYKKLKKAQVTQTDISSSVDKILQDEFDVVTYRVLAYLLLGVVRIFSKKVEYLFDDCNKLLLKIKEFVVSNKDRALVATFCAPYFSITLPERFELDAFDLEILEDTSGGNVMPLEDITLKDGMWKTGGIVPYSPDKYHCEEFAACQDICSAGYALNEDVLPSHLVDFEMEVGTSHDLSNLDAIIEKLQDNRFSLRESMDLEKFSVVEEEPLDPVKSFGEDHQNKGEHITTNDLQVVDWGEVHAESSMQELCHNSICQEACLNLETFCEVEEEPVRPSMPFSEHQTDRQQIEIPNMVQPEHENHPVIKKDCNLSNIEASMEKLRGDVVSQEECRDMEMFCTVEEPPEHGVPLDEDHHSDEEHRKLLEVEEPPEKTGPFGQEHQSDADHNTSLEMTTPGNSTCQVFPEDRPLSLTIDKTPQSKFLNASGVTSPEFLVIPTPSAKEGARATRKRKCLFDDVIVFSNNIIKQFIEDSSDLVSKRRKAPHTALAAWRASRVSSLPQCFLEPLIPCSSSGLRSLFCQKKLKILESLDAKKLPQKFRSECPPVGRSVETVEPLEKLDETKSCIDSRSIASMKSPEKLNVPTSPTVDRPVETVEPPEKLDMPESPTAGRSSEQMAIAPETPILHTKSLRSFKSPERLESLDISNLDRLRRESDKVEKELSPSKEQQIDLNLMNEEINLCEGDNQDQYGWSERTRVVARWLHRSFLDRKKRREDEVVNLLHLLEGRTKKESARFFYEILVLETKGYVHMKQENAFGDILIWKTSQWVQASGADCIEAAGGTTHFLQES